MDDRHTTAIWAGTLAAAEAIAFAAGLMVGKEACRRVGLRRVAVSTLMVATAGNVLSACAGTTLILLLARTLTGSAYGIAAAAGLVMLMARGSLHATAAGLAATSAFLVAVVYLLLGQAAASGGAAGLFLCLAAISSVCALLALGITGNVTIADHVNAARGDDLVLSLTCGMISVGSASVWAFAGEIGTTAGLARSMLGPVFAITALAGTVGGLAALAAPARRRFRFFAFAGVFGYGATCAALPLVKDAQSYVAVMTLLSFFAVFYQPFLIVSASSDRTGGLATQMIGWSALLTSVTPAIAGQLVDIVGTRSLSLVPVVTTAVSLFGLRIVMSRAPVFASNTARG